ncbi:MAG: hypothetical protein HYW49_04910 [Deltaproteobacteria bacterium]|nr:hypothetical protein [Deltaproteobacteria bacterium]
MSINSGLRLLAALTLVFSVTAAAAGGDPYNSFQWNRANALAKNGKTDRRPWYEWWYYKVVQPETERAFFFVYGVVNPWDLTGRNPASRAHLSFGDFGSRRIVEESRPAADFHASYDEPDVRIGENLATAGRIVGRLADSSGAIAAWDLSLETEWSFNAMGWGMSVPGLLDIFWYPAQASARMSGWIDENGERIELRDAPAYQDRNWGRAFPKWWAWIVSNRFKNSPGTALVAGGGKPRLFGQVAVYEGMTVGLKYGGKEYSFRPNDADRFKVNVRFGVWEVTAVNLEGYKIEISAYAPKEKFMLLPFMTPQGRVYRDYETLTGDLWVKLYKREGVWPAGKWKPVAALESREAGIEFGSYDANDVGLEAVFAGELRLQ